jgi:hypothetical protein
MSVAEKLERLVRIIPGVAGYQDKETSRETDKTLRLRLTTELEQVKRELEEDKRRLMAKKEFALLPALDGVASKLDKLGNLVKYAGRGYRGIFDTYKLDQKKLDQLYTFDLGLLDGLEAIKTLVKQVHDSHGDPVVLQKTIDDLSRSLDQLEKTISTRQNILISK